jgi:hypothetical protein
MIDKYAGEGSSDRNETPVCPLKGLGENEENRIKNITQGRNSQMCPSKELNVLNDGQASQE